MFRKNFPPSGNLIREGDVNTASDVIETARSYIEDAGEGETVKERLRSAARALGVPFGLVKRIRYGEIKYLPTHIFMMMTDRYGAVLTRREQQLSDDLARYRARLAVWGTEREKTAYQTGTADRS